MEYDVKKEERVWQRVRSEKHGEEPLRQGDQLQALAARQLELSAAYLQLSRLIQGRDGAVFVCLAREARAHGICLKGILTLTAGQMPQIAAAPVQNSSLDAMLRSCYGKEVRLMKEYETRSSDPEYGPVFERLRERGREHCCALMEMIGKTGKRK